MGKGGTGNRERLYRAGVRLFASRGYGATGVRDLAREGGVSLAAVSYFYGSKLGLLKAILADFFTAYREVLERTLAGDEQVAIRLRRAIVGLAEYFAEEPDKMVIALTELHHDSDEIGAFKAEHVARTIALIQARIAAPLARETGHEYPVVLLGPALISVVASHYLFRPMIERVRPPGYEPGFAARYPEAIADLLLAGLLGGGAQAEGGADG